MTISESIIEQVVAANTHITLVGNTDFTFSVDFSGIEKAIDELANKSKEEVDKEIGDAVELIFSNL